MFRRKKDHGGQSTAGTTTYAGRPGQEESMRVLAAFLAQPVPGAGAPGPAPASGGLGPTMGTGAPGPGMGTGAPGPGMASGAPGPGMGAATPAPPPPLAVTGWSGASPTPPPALNITPLVGPEQAYPNRPPTRNVPISGLGSVNADRFEQVYTQVNVLVTRLSGGADLSQRWTPDQVRTALAGLEVERSQARLTDEQYQALKAALESMLVQ